MREKEPGDDKKIQTLSTKIIFLIVDINVLTVSL